MRHPKTIEETTMGEIAWGAVKGVLYGALLMSPFMLLAAIYGDAIAAFIAGFN